VILQSRIYGNSEIPSSSQLYGTSKSPSASQPYQPYDYTQPHDTQKPRSRDLFDFFLTEAVLVCCSTQCPIGTFRELSDVFLCFDSGHNGVLSKEELSQAVFLVHPTYEDDFIDQLMGLLDLTGAGVVSFTEFCGERENMVGSLRGDGINISNERLIVLLLLRIKSSSYTVTIPGAPRVIGTVLGRRSGPGWINGSSKHRTHLVRNSSTTTTSVQPAWREYLRATNGDAREARPGGENRPAR
jgi:hypothetical protein